MAIAGQLAGALDAAHRAGPRAPRRQAEQRAARRRGRARALLPGRLRADPERRRARADRRAVHGHGRRTSRRSRSAATQVDGRADQYGLACLLFECLTGTVPYADRSDVATIFAHLEEPPPSASERRRDLPPAIDPVLARGMAKEPAERFESCAALVAAAADALEPPARPRRRARLVRWPPRRSCSWPRWRSSLLRRERRATARPPRRGGLVRIDPDTNDVVARTDDPRPPRRARRHARRALDGRLPRRRPVALRARRRAGSSASPRTASRATWPRSAPRSTSRPTAASCPAWCRATTRAPGCARTASTCSPARWRGGGVLWAAGCPFVQRLSTDRGSLRKLARGVPPVPVAGDGRELARAVPRAGDRRGVAVGARRRARPAALAARRSQRGDPGDDRARVRPTSVAVAAGTVWITDGVRRPRACRSTPERAPARADPGRSRAERDRGGRRVAVGREHARRHGVAARPARATVVATVDVAARRAASTSGAGAVWVTEHAF